jgi:2-polyprenyl-3-methyl-5-hydroxy-6-metoxy-1,4-benzoquinol methylase
MEIGRFEMTDKETLYRKLYDQVWNHELERDGEDFSDLELAELFLKKTDLPEKQHSILEIGCGIGKLCDRLYSMGYRNITGIDISSSAIALGKTRFPQLGLYCMDATSLKFPDGCFHICISFDLVEHIPDVIPHFREVWRVLKPAGKYLFKTPNIITNSLFSTMIFRGFGWRPYHPSLQFSWSLKKKLINAGFVKIEFFKIPPLISDYDKIYKIPKFARWGVKHIPWKYLPLFLQAGFFVVACK